MATSVSTTVSTGVSTGVTTGVVLQELSKEFYELYCIKANGMGVLECPCGVRNISISQDHIQRHIGVYGISGSVVAFVNEKGEYFILTLIRDAMSMLVQAGYRPGPLNVPISFGCQFTDPKVESKFRALVKRSQACTTASVVM